MQDGYETDYPEPTAVQRTPYPSLTQSGIGLQEQGVSNYTTLADYFDLESDESERDRSRPPAGDKDTANDDEDEDEDADEEIEGRRLMKDALSRYTGVIQTADSPSGFQVLPRNDGTQTTENGQTATGAGWHLAESRGRGPGRPRGSVRGRGAKGKGWKWALKGTEHADIFKKTRLQADPTIRKRGRQPRSRGGRGGKQVDPGSEFKKCMAQATKAFMEKDLDEAMEHAKDAIQANYEMFQPHLLIYQVLQKQGQERDSLGALAMAAIAKQRDPELWKTLAQGYTTLPDKTEADVLTAIHCYERVLQIDSSDYDARSEKLALYCELKLWNKARKESKNMVRTRPEDLDILREYAGLCVQTFDPFEWRRAIEAYEKAFDFFKDQDTLGDEEGQWDHLNMYLDLLAKLNQFEEAVYHAKRLARWFVGRKDDTFWNYYTADDREFDSSNERRGWVRQFQEGRVTRNHQLYGDGLPMEIRVKLGLFRLRMGYSHHEEAFQHFEYLRSALDHVEDYYDLFFEVAEAVRSYRLWRQAVDFYEPIKTMPEVSNAQFWNGLALCYWELGQANDAEECYCTVVDFDEDNMEARVQLVKLYEATGQREKQMSMATQVISLGRKDVLRKEQMKMRESLSKMKKPKERPLRSLLPKEAPQEIDDAADEYRGTDISSDDSDDDIPNESTPTSVRKPKAKKPRQANAGRPKLDERMRELQQQRVRIRPHYDMVKDLWPLIESGEDEEAIQDWMYHASAMADEFKKTGAFYPIRSRDPYFTGLRTGIPAKEKGLIREMEDMKKKLQSVAVSAPREEVTSSTTNHGIPGDFHDISFVEWHRILCDLALLRAKYLEQTKCYYLLQEVLMPANVFLADSELKNTTLAVCICCAMMFNDSELMLNTARQYMLLGQKRSGMAYQLLSASGRLGFGPSHLLDLKAQRWINTVLQHIDRPEDTHGSDPGLLTLYAHSISNHKMGRSDQPLPFLLRALAIQPENTVINLSIANTYIAKAMSLSSENKQYGIAQGLAFFYRYYDLRVKSGKASHLQEAEYNLARMWHQLGLVHLAVPAYQKVSKFSGDVQQAGGEDGCQNMEEITDFSQEAAFALQSIFVAAGNRKAAAAIAEEWLVL